MERLGAEVGGTAANNGLLHHSIRSGFVALQTLRIAKIADPRGATVGDVISLPRVLKDIGKFRESLTREWAITQASAYHNCEALNEGWDALCGVAPENRTGKDIISEYTINELDRTVRSARERVEVYRNKFLAHAAEPDSRRNLSFQDLKLTWNILEEGLSDLTKVTRTISEVIAVHPRGYTVNVALKSGALRGLEKPYLSPNQRPSLNQWLHLEQTQISGFSKVDIAMWLRSLQRDSQSQ
jgi:hypothetical protein